MFPSNTNRPRTNAACRLAGLLLAAGFLSVGLAGPASAQNDRGQGPPGRYERSYRRDPPRDRGHDDRGPNVYDSAPPIVYAPPAYYQQPGPVLLLNIPLFR